MPSKEKKRTNNEKIRIENENNQPFDPEPSAIVSTLEVEAVFDIRLLISFNLK
jgi:hypothetical protein